VKNATTGGREAKDAEQATDLLVTVASTLNERLAITADELARSQILLREASDELMTAFRGAADRIVDAQRHGRAEGGEKAADYDVVLDHLYRAVQHLQSHDLVNQLIDTQKLRVDKMREKLREALSLAVPRWSSRTRPTTGSNGRGRCSTASSPGSRRSTTRSSPPARRQQECRQRRPF